MANSFESNLAPADLGILQNLPAQWQQDIVAEQNKPAPAAQVSRPEIASGAHTAAADAPAPQVYTGNFGTIDAPAHPNYGKPPEVTPVRSVGPDPYYDGTIPRTHIMYDIGKVADVALPLGGAITAQLGVASRFGRNYASSATREEASALGQARNQLGDILREANGPELSSLNGQVRRIASQMGVRTDEPYIMRGLNTSLMTDAERQTFSRWSDLQFPSLGNANIQAAKAASPRLADLIEERATQFGTAITEHSEAVTVAESFAQNMRRGGLLSIGIGEAANIGLDFTLFKDTPHSMRTILCDTVAPAIALTSLPWQVKAAAIVGSHVINRIWDNENPDTGKF